MQSSVVICASVLYLAVLFAIAWLGERLARDRPLFARGSLASAVLYTLTLAVHNTAWLYYGTVGRAATNGYLYLATFIGPTLFLLFGHRLLLRIITIAKARNVTSVADFISALFERRGPIAAFVTIAMVVASLPYIALQLEATAVGFRTLTGTAGDGSIGDRPFFEDTAFWTATLAAAFACSFGVRNIHASKRHRGFVLALAFESLVKLAAFAALALYVVYGMFDGPGDLLMRARDIPGLGAARDTDATDISWYSVVTISLLAFVCSPQVFHVAVVENDNPADVRPAAVLYPAYYAILIGLIAPIGLGGLVALGTTADPDTYTIALPIVSGQPLLALAVFIGGLAAATGMVVVSTVALATMLCNDIVVPLLLRRWFAEEPPNVTWLLLWIRRVLVVFVLLSAYVTQRLVGERLSLTETGLVSYVAIAQFAPAFFGGMLWRKASFTGAFTGMAAGFAIWLYTLAIPSMAPVLGLPLGFLEDGPWGVGWLRPDRLLGLGSLDPISHAALWSLAVNVSLLVLVSLARAPSEAARRRAYAFLDGRPASDMPLADDGFATRLAELAAIAAKFVGCQHADIAFNDYLAARERCSGRPFDLASLVDDNAVAFAEDLIAGAIGAASARIVVATSVRGRRLSRGSATSMLADAAAALHQKHALLRAITENVPQGICALDADLRVSAWNSRFAELLDLPAGILEVGLPLLEIVAYHKARGEYSADQLGLEFVDRDPSMHAWPHVYERTRPDGTVVEVTFNRMDVGGYVATYADVTDRHRAAQALRAANELLEQRVRERTAALERVRKEAEEANASKTRFLAATSHDLLQPLSAARLFLSAQQVGLHERGGSDFDARKVATYSENALAALQSAEDLLSELLYMSSLESHAIRPALQRVDIGAMLTQLGAEFSGLASNHGLSLRVVTTRSAARTDPALLRRVVQNFVSNSIRYTPKGRVLLGCRRRGDCICIEVWDTGVGIPENMCHEIFQEFRRLVQDSPSAERGFGLGLAIVERIARLLEAPVIVRSKPGLGSMFAIEVPREQSIGLEPSHFSMSIPIIQSSRGLSVLCIDNDQLFRDGMTALVEQWGHRIFCARDLETALASHGDAGPDVVLVDYHLDGPSSGLDALGVLRRHWTNDVLAILVTADRADNVQRAARAARCELLHKPVKPAALRRYLSRAGSARQKSGVEE